MNLTTYLPVGNARFTITALSVQGSHIGNPQRHKFTSMKLGTNMLSKMSKWRAPALLLVGLAAGPVAAASVGLDLERFRAISIGFNAELKCQHLTEARREELALHAAFAETAAVRANGADAVRDARRHSNPPKSCGETSLLLVKTAIETGREFENTYAAAHKNRSGKRISARQQRIRQKQQENRVRTAAFFSVRKESDSTHVTRTSGSTQRFETQLKAYYINHRCRFLSYRKARKFWKMINNRHALLAGYIGKPALSQISHTAKSSAANAGCTRQARRFVANGLRDISSVAGVN